MAALGGISVTKFLYLPGKVPVLGMRSSIDPAAVGGGYWQLLDNIRFTRQSLQTRLGCAQLTSAAVTSGASYRGHWLGRLNGEEVLVAAYRVGTQTRIYRVDLSTWAFTEITANDFVTRFTHDGDVCFASVRELGLGNGYNEGRDYLYISNGFQDPAGTDNPDDPLAWANPAPNVSRLSRIDTSTLPIGSFRAMPRGFVKISNASNFFFPLGNGDGTHISFNNTGGSTANEIQYTFHLGSGTVGGTATTAFLSDSCVKFQFNPESTVGSLDCSESDQLWLVLKDDATDPVTTYLDISLGLNTPITVYEATAADRVAPAIVPLSGGYYLAGIALPRDLQISLNDVDAIAFKCSRAFVADRTFRLSGMLASGRVFNGVDYTYTWAASGNRNESAGIVPVELRTDFLTSYGCPPAVTNLLPQADSLRYQYRINYGNGAPAGTDSLFIYRSEPGDVLPLLASALSQYPDQFAYDNVPSLDRVIFRTAPSAAMINPRAGQCALGANNRLYVGGVSDGKNQIWISDDGFPWRFRPLPTDEDGDGLPDQTSGLSCSLPGEDIYQIIAMPGSFVGVAPVVVFTNQSTWRLEGIDTASLSRPTKIAAHGTVYPRSVTEFRGTVCYLDADLVVRRLGGGVDDPPLSLYKVDDQLENGDPSKAAGFFYKERYGLAYRANGASTNQRVLVYEIMAGEWCRDSYSAANQNWAGFAEQGIGTGRRLLGFTNEGRIYQLEKSGQPTDDGTAIAITLKTPELHQDLWTECFWGRLGIVCDKTPTPVTLTTSRTDPLNSANAGILSGSIDVNSPTTDRAYRWDGSGANHVPTGMDAPSCVYQLTGSYPPGKFIKALVYEFDSYEVDRADAG